MASYLSPIQEYMASLLPPSKENGYVRPPPSTEYLTPLKEHKGKWLLLSMFGSVYRYQRFMLDELSYLLLKWVVKRLKKYCHILLE